ncbi:hypothetical protein Ahy_A02g006061 isoform E [Arachis hypogaea]|uniref:Uncharacterized protein n=1 Tax=Arachis hypogaea TaxID=3818 RepID=A0A445E8R9_ARAHY|nr:hypothetical protein Ahy_A02g006061 isoform E [Arachis hypogaea]
MLCRIWYPPSSKRNPSHPPKAAPAGGPVAVAVAAVKASSGNSCSLLSLILPLLWVHEAKNNVPSYFALSVVTTRGRQRTAFPPLRRSGNLPVQIHSQNQIPSRLLLLMEHAKDDFDVNDYSEEDEKEQLRKTKVDGVMVSWNNLRYKCPESGRGTREETASKKLQHKANNSDFFF